MAEKQGAIGSNQTTIIFTSARMNPPTPGHLLLIQRLIQEAIRQSVEDVYIILSKSNSDNENPIDCTSKIELLSESGMKNMTSELKLQMISALPENEDKPEISQNINMIQVHYRCVLPHQPSPFSQIGSIINEYKVSGKSDLNLFMIVGDDRANTVDSVADQYLFKDEHIHSINCLVLARENMSQYKSMSCVVINSLDISTIHPSAFSASFIRKVVKCGLHHKFIEIYDPYLSHDKINQLYEEILNGLSKPGPKKGSEKEIPVKYMYPIIRDTEYFNQLILEKASKTPRKTKKNTITPHKSKSVKGKTAKRKSEVISSDEEEEEDS